MDYDEPWDGILKKADFNFTDDLVGGSLQRGSLNQY